MEAKINSIFRVGVFTVPCILAVLLSIGCETSDTMAVSPTNPACPLCGCEAQAQPLADVDSTRAICPVCGDVSTVDPQFLERLEIFTGGPLGDTVYACASCRAVVEQCAACRQRGGSPASRNNRSWQ